MEKLNSCYPGPNAIETAKVKSESTRCSHDVIVRKVRVRVSMLHVRGNATRKEKSRVQDDIARERGEEEKEDIQRLNATI